MMLRAGLGTDFLCSFDGSEAVPPVGRHLHTLPATPDAHGGTLNASMAACLIHAAAAPNPTTTQR